MLTISKETQERLQKHSYDIVEAIGVIGGTNVQFAHDPVSGRLVVIEINPRTSRSSALASKATGFPIALISAMLASGMTLDEIPYWRDGTLEKYTPSGDYVVVKFARWAFEKFKGVEDKLGTQMRAVGEVMSIGKNYKEAFQKAIRSLENGRYGLGFARNFNSLPLEELMQRLTVPNSERHFLMYEAIRKGATVEQLFEKTFVKRWFIEQMAELVALEEKILKYKGKALPDKLLKQAKQDGFADRYLAKLLDTTEEAIRAQRFRSAALRMRPITIRRTMRRIVSPSAIIKRRLWCSAAGRIASGRALSLTIAASIRRWPCANWGTRPSWSTATRRPSRRIMTPRTSCTLSR
jgi:carbamoyl-phosphate synthase large subunit